MPHNRISRLGNCQSALVEQKATGHVSCSDVGDNLSNQWNPKCKSNKLAEKLLESLLNLHCLLMSLAIIYILFRKEFESHLPTRMPR